MFLYFCVNLKNPVLATLKDSPQISQFLAKEFPIILKQCVQTKTVMDVLFCLFLCGNSEGSCVFYSILLCKIFPGCRHCVDPPSD